MKMIALAGALALALPAVAQARDLGMQGQPCAMWTRDLATPAYHAIDLAWMLGYVAGAVPNSTYGGLVGSAAIEAGVRTYCAAHADATILEAARNVADRLR